MYLLPDTTVLSNFAAVHGMSHLREYLGDRGRWVQSIADEVRRGVAVLSGLEIVISEDWFGRPIALDGRGEDEQVERFRRLQMFGDPTAPRQHLGESESFVAMRRNEFRDSIFLTDDFDAHRVFLRYGVIVHDTRDVVTALVARGSLTAQDGLALCEEMQRCDRVLRRPPTTALDLR